MHARYVAFDNRVSRRDFLKFLGAGATTIAFGSLFGFSTLLSGNNKSGRGIGSSSSGIQQAAPQSTTSGSLVAGPNTGIISIHAANLTNGKIMYAAGSGFSSQFENGPFLWNTFDPDTGSITNHTVGEDLFCMGQSVFPIGKVLCAGGSLRYDDVDPDGNWKGLASAYEYDPSSDSLTQVQSMKHGRWYPYCLTLDDGKVLTIGGYDEWGCYNLLAEIYDPDSKSWSIKYDPTTSTTYCVGYCPDRGSIAPPGLPCYGGSGQGVVPPDLYPRAIFMPTGLVAIAGQISTTRTSNPALENG